MPGKVKGRRVLITVSPKEEAAIKVAAQFEHLPVATFIRRAAVLAAEAEADRLASGDPRRHALAHFRGVSGWDTVGMRKRGLRSLRKKARSRP